LTHTRLSNTRRLLRKALMMRLMLPVITYLKVKVNTLLKEMMDIEFKKQIKGEFTNLTRQKSGGEIRARLFKCNRMEEWSRDRRTESNSRSILT